MTPSNVKYRETHFERANLSPIHGDPTFERLHKLRNEIKANTRYIYSHLGGGTHGHLGLVLTVAQYALISPTASGRLPHPARWSFLSRPPQR